MKEHKTKPFLPFISIPQILNFDRNKPETYTQSRLINELCIAFEEVGTHSVKDVAKFMQLDPTGLSHAVRIITGYKLVELNELVTKERIRKILHSGRYKDIDDVAKQVGYADRSSLYRLLGRREYDYLIAKYTRR